MVVQRLLIVAVWSTGFREHRLQLVAAHKLSSCSSEALELRLSSCGAWA